MGGKSWRAHEIRRSFIDFFVEKGHVEIPGSPLVPKGDPTLLFTSAGMVQFKDYYLQPDNLQYSRAVSVQKCLRAGDLESVGKTLRHHTFFEMLGNFSFGDYFKREAIKWAWEFVVDRLGLPQQLLHTSVFEDDDEAYMIWKSEIGIPAERIVRLGRKDNFWGPVGRTGVCGPCSEIYYDNGPEKGCGGTDCAPGCDCDRYLEFWNLVFPQFFLGENGEFQLLQKPGIDTGLGLERLATILQGVEDNFHTDLFSPVVDALLEILPGDVDPATEGRMGVNMAADHLRALVFTISEGVYPANEGRGYLLRRLLRRALTRFYTLGVEEPFLHGLVDLVVDVMKVDYPELEDRRENTAMIIRSEEDSFFRTLDDGKSRFRAVVGEVKSRGGTAVAGRDVFLLYDTFGFPVELTKALASAEGLGIDEKGFERAMEAQRRRAQERSAFTSGESEVVSMVVVTEGPSSRFTGHESVGGRAAVRRYREAGKSDKTHVEWGSPDGPAFEIVLDATPFYATAGGQVADKGWIEAGGMRFEVRDVFRRGGEIIHLVEPSERGCDLAAILEKEPEVRVRIDEGLRLAAARNHTATHLLHAALREVVGRHVTQSGSLVDGGRLRFDFNHFQPISPESRREIQDRVNGWIRECLPVRTVEMDYQEALESGAIALFDEKYGKKVRVVRVGDISVELCGGTHVENTGQIGFFLILSEGSVAAGVRRIEAYTGASALGLVQSAFEIQEELAALLKVSPQDVVMKAHSLLRELDDSRRRLRRMERGETGNELDGVIKAAGRVDGILVASGRISVKKIASLRNQADIFRSRVKSGIAVLSALIKGKLQFVVAVTDDLIDGRGVTADMLVDELSGITGGSGGGKKHLAQLGSKSPDSEAEVFAALPETVKRIVSERKPKKG